MKKKLKELVDAEVARTSKEKVLFKLVKMNQHNQNLLDAHVMDKNKKGVKKVTKDIETNNEAIKYLTDEI